MWPPNLQAPDREAGMIEIIPGHFLDERDIEERFILTLESTFETGE